jgi:sec-independent protein translocase protein TatA
MNFFGIGLPEMAVIAAIGLLVFGPKRLPELGKTLGKTLRGFQSASQEFEKEFRQAVSPEPDASGAQAAPSVAEMPPASLSAGSTLPVGSATAASSDTTAEPAASATPAPAVGDPAGS